MGKKEKIRGKGGKTSPSSTPEAGGPSSSSPSAISKRGWKIIFGGVFTVILGFFVLSLTDPMGQNWASDVSPFLLIGGYALIGFGIVTKDPHQP